MRSTSVSPFLPALIGLLCLVHISTAWAGEALGTGSLEQVKRQLRQYLLEDVPADPALARQYADSLHEDGSWADIDYTNKDRADWIPMIHLVRLTEMAKALAADPEARADLEKPILRALAYWREHDFKCPNWFQNRIGSPRRLLQIAVLLDKRLPQADFDYITRTATERCGIGKSTGQNRVWLAGCVLINGLLLGDEKRVAGAASTIFAECAVTSDKEGIQADYSFHQHGPQQQFGNYGLSLAGDQIEWLSIMRGTPWAMSPAHVDTLRRYLLDGENWVVWRGSMDTSSCGRQFQPGGAVSKASRLSCLMRAMSTLDPSHSAEYQSFVRRNNPAGSNDLIGCRYFWRSDYLICRRKDWCLTVKMSSNRVIGSESLNGQNLSGYHLADGAAYIYRTGEEYGDIYPLWNWRMLPGVTCAQNQGPLPRFATYRLQTDFAGAVTDGTDACAALDYSRDGVTARKAWFVYGDCAVCLGSGVGASPEVTARVSTAVNQCFLRGKVRIGDGGTTRTLGRGVHKFSDLKWVEHDGLRYTFSEAQSVIVALEKRTDSWNTVMQTGATPKEKATGEVFTVSIDHGAAPAGGSYAYCISPTAAAPPDFRIISNTTALQAVGFADRSLQAVFHAPGEVKYGGHTLTTDAPCLLLVDLARHMRLTVADPTQKLTSLTLMIDGKKLPVHLPSGPEAGKSVTLTTAAARPLPQSAQGGDGHAVPSPVPAGGLRCPVAATSVAGAVSWSFGSRDFSRRGGQLVVRQPRLQSPGRPE